MLQTIRAKIYGDSIMKGTVLDCAYRYHALFDRYFRRFAERFNIEVDNRSRFGITIDKGYKLLLQDIEAGMDADFALIEFGGNDSNFRWDEISRNPEGRQEPLTRVEHFREVVYTMIRELRGAGAARADDAAAHRFGKIPELPYAQRQRPRPHTPVARLAPGHP